MTVGSVAVQVFVFFPEEDKVGVKTIKTFAERMRNEGVNRAVMVTQVNMTPFARQCLQEMAPKYYIEVVRLLQQSCWVLCRTSCCVSVACSLVAWQARVIARHCSRT